MDIKVYPLNSFFKLYSSDGLQISFSVNGERIDEHLTVLDELRAKLTDRGYRLQPEEVSSGERVEEITGWVLGETKEGKPCVHLYKSPLKFKITTLWEEMLPSVPITIGPNVKAVIQAPELEQAEQRGWLQPCDFRIILKQRTSTDGTPILSDKGKPTWRFDRMYGAPAKAEQESSRGGNGVGSTELPPGDPYLKIYNSVSTEAKKIIDWGRRTQLAGGELAGVDQITELTDYLDVTLRREGAGNLVLQVLSGEEDASYMEGFVEKLSELVSVQVLDNDGNTVMNPKYKEEYVKALTQIVVVGMPKVKAKTKA